MLGLARDRAGGAYPYLVTPDYVATARAALGPDRTLAVLVSVVLEADPDRAREAARESLRFLATVPGYINSFRRMGFSGDDVSGLSARLIDAVVAWGDVDRVTARIGEYRDTGADQIVLAPRPARPGEPASAPWRLLAESLLN
jgi:probable F420-dependent oxidoreductase